MTGAREYARLFETGQHGRLYLVSGSHARGDTFRVYVLPKDEDAIPNGPNNSPLNANGVEVYGVISGQLGWTEVYGWLRKGKWEADFHELVARKRAKDGHTASERAKAENDAKAASEQRELGLLSEY